MGKDSDLMHCKSCAYNINCGEKDCRDYEYYKALKERETLMKRVTEIIQNKPKENKKYYYTEPPQMPRLGRTVRLGDNTEIHIDSF